MNSPKFRVREWVVFQEELYPIMSICSYINYPGSYKNGYYYRLRHFNQEVHEDCLVPEIIYNSSLLKALEEI